MRIRTFATAVVALALVGVGPAVFAQGQTQGQAQTKPDPKPEAKPDAKAATVATLVGKWNVDIANPNGAMQAAFEIKADPKDAKKLTGNISSPAGEAAFEGEVLDGKLTFWFKMNANGTDLAVTFTGALQKDGSLAGTLEYGQGAVPWTAIREKK